jgi:hypothetical protein
MPHRLGRAVAVLALAFVTIPAASGIAAGPLSGQVPPGWEESVPGRWNSLPERKAVLRDNTTYAEFVLSPGTAVEWERMSVMDNASAQSLAFELAVTATNRSSKDYRPFEARFPVSVTAVFGEDSVEPPFRTRVWNFFLGVWHGFLPGGIRLTYAIGNVVPVGSMYRLDPEETVFILAGDEEKGKKVAAKRNLYEDFMAAYGRPPKGPVTRIVLRAERPSGEEGTMTCGILLSDPKFLTRP